MKAVISRGGRYWKIGGFEIPELEVLRKELHSRPHEEDLDDPAGGVSDHLISVEDGGTMQHRELAFDPRCYACHVEKLFDMAISAIQKRNSGIVL